jgi:hypothetical protein
MSQEMLGLVRDGRFVRLTREGLGDEVALTTIGMQEAVAPEARRLDLSEAEGRVVVVRGLGGAGGGWWYESAIVEIAGPATTKAVVGLLGASAAAA